MSDLKSIDRIKLERFFEMEDGYVCDFSDKTFGDFILESTGIDVYTDEYAKEGTSKAKRLRTFWKKESNYSTSKLINELSEYWKSKKTITSKFLQQYKDCLKIADRIQKENPIEDIDALQPNSGDSGFSVLANSIRESLKRDEPDQAIDRLHTFLVKYIRTLCDRHSIQYKKETTLHALFGGYLKFLKEKNIIESEMSQRILKSMISILDAFNSVRNNQSFAHDNKILNYDESVLIFNNILSILRFIRSLESKILEKNKKEGGRVILDNVEYSMEEINDAAEAWMELQSDIRRGK